jgi:hypothetical protein
MPTNWTGKSARYSRNNTIEETVNQEHNLSMLVSSLTLEVVCRCLPLNKSRRRGVAAEKERQVRVHVTKPRTPRANRNKRMMARLESSLTGP